MKHSIFTLAIIAMSMLAFSSCDKDKNANGTKDSVNVAQENLVLHMNFESKDNLATVKGGISNPKVEGNATFPLGRRGNCYQGAASSYLVVDLAKDNFLSKCNSFTIACWLTCPTGGGAPAVFSVNGGDTGMGHLTLLIENGQYDSGNDITAVKGYLYNNKDIPWKGQDILVKDAAFQADKWFHYIFSYDAETSILKVYANGMIAADSIRYSADIDGNGNQPLLGELVFGGMTKLYIGAWSSFVEGLATDEWRSSFEGKLDELRVYNKALSDEEVSQLFTAEVEAMNE